MSAFDEQYIDLCYRILEHGEKIVNYKKDAKNTSERNRKGAKQIKGFFGKE